MYVSQTYNRDERSHQMDILAHEKEYISLLNVESGQVKFRLKIPYLLLFDFQRYGQVEDLIVLNEYYSPFPYEEYIESVEKLSNSTSRGEY